MSEHLVSYSRDTPVRAVRITKSTTGGAYYKIRCSTARGVQMKVQVAKLCLRGDFWTIIDFIDK